jgi:DNA-binding transcriptional regulator YhcF (GntR family)
VSQQLADAVRKAAVSGQLRPDDAFPSVRRLSQELRIHPREARQGVEALLAAGILQCSAKGSGPITVAPCSPLPPAERLALLANDLERLVTEARRLGIAPEDLVNAVHVACSTFREKPDATGH